MHFYTDFKNCRNHPNRAYHIGYCHVPCMIKFQTKIKSKFIISETFLTDGQIEMEYVETMVLMKMNVEYKMEFELPKNISKSQPIQLV